MAGPELPPFAPFPTAAWKELLSIDDWNAALGGWISLAEAHLSFDDSTFTQKTLRDGSVPAFLTSFMKEVAHHGPGLLGTSNPTKLLLKDCFLLASKTIRHPSFPLELLQWEFLSDFSRVYSKSLSKKRVSEVLSQISSQDAVETSLAAVKKFLIKNLDDGINGDLKAVENRLRRINSLISASPSTAAFFLAGSEFLDGLIACYTVMNPPLRMAIVTTTYLSLMGLAEGSKFSILTDQLYSLKTAAEAHKAGPLNANDCLVRELVSTTPLIQQIERKTEASGADNSRVKNVLRELATWKKSGAGIKPKRLIKRKIDKGKSIAMGNGGEDQEIHVHRLSKISQIQDIFPDLGAGFVARLLDEYGENTEEVTAHLLEDSLPTYLKEANRSEELSTRPRSRRKSSLIPKATPPQLPTRHNVFDDDELDRLALDASKLHIGKRGAEKTADDLLADRSSAPSKAAIISALAAFDSDDDERDDTYDAADVGGAIDAAANEEDPTDANEETLWRAYSADPRQFDRDQAARKGAARGRLREDTGMTDEAIEGWAIMLNRNAQQKRRLEMKYSAVNAFSGQQTELVRTSWQEGAENSDTDGGSGRGGHRGRGRGRGGRGRGGGAGRGGSVAGPSGEQETEAARRRKEANKSQRANHNRRDQRAKKMARGGAFPA
ncbi:hypothetical protein N0V93_008129 [Gnomoniopsis smithogilvyi]|uniref:CUE domain-containing protein n=1 Tax=Gnomoniopsis smithogilvyi TaxID=1191159 RepID=A0A9W8YL49_9PEZI|nr:hypothetical protein N0V93_008129 [Gnomoniopsis smithogilvyi]